MSNNPKHIFALVFALARVARGFKQNPPKKVTLLEKKGTLCPPDHLLSYVKQYRCSLIPDDVAFLGNKGTNSPPYSQYKHVCRMLPVQE